MNERKRTASATPLGADTDEIVGSRASVKATNQSDPTGERS